VGRGRVVSGLIAFVLADAPPEQRNLPAMRALLNNPPEALEEIFRAMAETEGFSNLAKAAAAIGLAAVGRDGTNKNKEYIGGARDNTEWLDSDAMRPMLSGSSLDLADLKTGRCSVFLVIPPEYLADHGRFLRLFVRCALNTLMKGGKSGHQCLFLLDEFHALGHIDQVHKAAGLMPKNGVHLWPFLQDLGQLTSLYKDEGAETFFANADAHIYFGNTDGFTLGHISENLGIITQDDIGIEPPERSPDPVSEDEYREAHKPQGGLPLAGLLRGPRPGESHFSTGSLFRGAAMVGGMVYQGSRSGAQVAKQFDIQQRRDAQAVEDENARREYDHAMRALNSARVPPGEVRELVAKRDGDLVARSMIVFAKGDDVLNLRLAPYFEKREPRPATREADAPAKTGPGAELPAVIKDAQRKLRIARTGLEYGAQSMRKAKTATALQWLAGAGVAGVAAWLFGQHAGLLFYCLVLGSLVCGGAAIIQFQDIGDACERARIRFTKDKREAEQVLMRYNKQYGGTLLDCGTLFD